MNKLQENMEKMVALLPMTYTIGLLIRESIRDHRSGLSVRLKQKILIATCCKGLSVLPDRTCRVFRRGFLARPEKQNGPRVRWSASRASPYCQLSTKGP
jgi:hypothetical protein